MARSQQILTRLRRPLRVMILSAVGFAFVFSGFLLFFQRQLIYFPESYSEGELRSLGNNIRTLSYETAQGIQHAYYVQPKESPDEPPDYIWAMFNGNASRALDWIDFLRDYPDPSHGFLLIEYPGYGESEGKPSPASIREASEKGFAKLAEELDVGQDALEKNLGTMGFSLGAATSLPFAVEHAASRVILISPFTSMIEMARRTAPPPFHNLLLHRYDNRARLRDLCSESNSPQILIVHGAGDPVIPVQMGRELSRICPDRTTYVEIERGDHNAILWAAREEILEVMAPEAPLEMERQTEQ